MGRCNRCGKRGLFFKVNKAGMCYQCQLDYDAEQMRKHQEEKLRLQEERKKKEDQDRIMYKQRAIREAESANIGKLGYEKIAGLLRDDALYNTGFTERLEEYNRVQKEKKNHKRELFEQRYAEFEKARTLEKEGKLEEAAELYKKNVKYGEGTVYFDRPCIVLEKLGRYEEAIEICNIAIDKINKGKFNADVNSYINRKERLYAKMGRDS